MLIFLRCFLFGDNSTKNQSEYALKGIRRLIGSFGVHLALICKALIITCYASQEHFYCRNKKANHIMYHNRRLGL